MSKVYTASEVEKHNTPKKLWIVIRKNVYDVTAYLNEHPGGIDPLLEAGGMDATNAFEEVGHSSDAKKILKKYKIGTLAPGDKCVPGTNVCVYRCEDDANPWRKKKLPCSDSLSSNRSKSTLQHNLKSRSTSQHINKSKSGCSLKKTDSKKKSNTTMSTPSSLKCCNSKSQVVPLPIPRVPSIVVPRSRRGGVCRPIPRPRGGKLKWALLALAVAIVAGVAYKKYAS